MKRSHLISLALFVATSACASRAVLAEQPIDRYDLPSTDKKLLDNHGEGYDALYGARNFRLVLASTFYRGGANNAFNRYGKRPNRNPLPTMGLENLCQEGFDTAIYLYSTNYDAAPKKVDCIDRRTGQAHSLKYLQLSPYNETSLREIFSIVYSKVKEARPAPAYAHCWNGWHASGLISAFTLRQFCGFSGEEAVRYWNRNTDGNHTDPGFEALRQQIRDFVPYTDLQLTETEQKKICLPALRR